MPEFHIDLGSPEGARAYGALDPFTRSYFEALFFTDSGQEEGQLGDATFADFYDLALARQIEECSKFQRDNTKLLADAIGAGECDIEHAGRDFWYTRNGHGCGFWDGDWPAPYGDRLSDAAEDFREVCTFIGDDGKVHV